MRILTSPTTALKHLWRKFPVGSFQLRQKFDAFSKPSYAYGIYRAAQLAHSLDLKEVTVIEFGVAAGGGLIAMEKIALEVEKIFGIKIHVFGLDTGEGLTAPMDYRDMSYEWSPADFPMEVGALRGKLTKARLILGDVRDSAVVEKIWEHTKAPIGFVSFDLDMYSPTKAAMNIFNAGHERVLPRVYLYFDDIFGEEADCCEYTGERLAINEFNEEHQNSKISKHFGLTASRYVPGSWSEGAYILHNFYHPLYNRKSR